MTDIAPFLVILRGLPGSGKTYHAEQWLSDNTEWGIRVNDEDIAQMTYGYRLGLTRLEKDNIRLLKSKMVSAALSADLSVVDDNLNLDAESVKNLYRLGIKHGAEIIVKKFDDVSVDECVSRDRSRTHNKYGESAIRSLNKRFLHKGKIKDVPMLKDNSIDGKAYIPNPDLPKAVWLDLDGTYFTFLHHRGPYEFEKVHLDAPVPHIVDLVRALKADGYKIVVMSGRDESCKELSLQALAETGLVPDDIFMRPMDSDGIPDNQVKHDLFWKYVAPKYNVRFALDDRQQVVDFTRNVLKIPVLQVAPGDF